MTPAKPIPKEIMNSQHNQDHQAHQDQQNFAENETQDN